jgi:tetratricopeptide (TPR) repeat protein
VLYLIDYSRGKMVSPWRIIKWVWHHTFVLIALGILITVASDIITERIPHEWKEKMISIIKFIITFCFIHWMYSILFLAIVFISCLYFWVRENKNEFGKIWEFYKPVKKLKPEDFKIQGYKKAHITRKSDTTIGVLLKNKEYILITGKPKAGKTRAAYEAIKKLENISVIKSKPEEIEIEKIKIPSLSNKNFILFLDDLEDFIDKKIEYVIDILKKRSKKLIVVATCRTGKELDLVKAEMYRQFETIKIEDISENDGEKLVEDIKKEDVNFKWNKKQFDGTPGSVTLDLEDMTRRYKNANNGKVILKALKLLKEGNLSPYGENRVKDVCEGIFELPSEEVRRHIWDEAINNLKENSFITIDKGVIDIYSGYLDVCVYDYEPLINDLIKLKSMLIRMNDPRSLFYLGNGFLYKKDFIHAEDCYLAALEIHPQYASAYNSLGYVLIKLGEAEEAKGRYGKAEELYTKALDKHNEAIKISPYYAADHNNLGYALTRLGEIKEIKGEYDEAKRLYQDAEEKHRTAIKINADYPSAHHSLAYALGKLGKNEEEEKEYRKAIELNAESPFAHNLFGHFLANKLGKDEEAENEYREAIRIKSDYPSAHNNLGYLLAKLGRWKEAEKEYREAIRASPDYIVAYVNLGNLLTNLGKYEEAEKEYRKAIDINPNYAEAHIALGYTLTNLKRYDEAEKEYRKAIKIKQNYMEAHRHLGYLLVVLGNSRYDEAEKEYRKALQISPNDESTLISLGVLLERLNRDKEAEDCYKEAIGKNPNNVKALTTYGYFLSYRGREEEAIRVFKKVLEVYPDDTKIHNQITYIHSKFYELSDTYAHCARALIRSGKFDEAKNDLLEALRLDSNIALAHKNLGILQEELGDRAQNEEDKLKLYKEAEKEYRKAIELNDMYPSAHRHLANTLGKIGKYEEAEKEYKETTKVVANYPVDNYPKNDRDYGIFLFKIGRKEEAKNKLEIAIKLFEAQGNKKEAEKIKELLKNL